MKTITYFAADASMGATSADDCAKYREWAERQLQAEYPDHEINVVNKESFRGCFTDDEENIEDITEFCHELWDKCPWDWIFEK